MTARVFGLAGRITVLTVIWVLLWGRISAANVASGVLVSLILLAVFPSQRNARLGSLRPLALGHLALHIAWQLVVSNMHVSREVVTRRSRIQTGIVACRLRTDSESTIAFIANVLSLTPGTMPVHVQTDPPAIYVHVLHLRDPVDVRRGVARLEDLTVRSFGSTSDVGRLRSRLHRFGAGLPASDEIIEAGPR